MFLILSATTLAFAQNTGISGVITDSNGDPLPGAVVNAVHQPTGTTYNSVSRADGRYNILNMRVGGPYEVSVNMTGFKSSKQGDIFLKLGENKKLSFQLYAETVEESLVVVASSNPLINPSRTGAFSNVTTESLEKLPTINRSLADFARTNSYFTQDREFGSLSVGGRNNRYNSIQIDGSANTDLFGLAGSNTPGGQTESQPISIDAIAELELIVSPYDVRYGGFTGGGINAVTRGGTNSFDGSVYYTFRDSSYVGDGPEDLEFGEFENTQLGARIGGPLIKDKLFFFVNVERNRQDQPSDWLISQQESRDAQEFGHIEEAQEFLDILRDVYGYDPGGFGEFTRKTDSDNIFVRFDYNINATHKLTMRHNFVESNNHSRERSDRDFEFPDGFYLIEDETNSTVFKLNSTFGSFVNEVRLNYTTIKDRRGPEGDPFPFIEVGIGGGLDLRAGTERFSHANALDQKHLEINEELTFFKGAHTVTVGVNLQQIEFNNLFIQDHYGNYDFRTLDDFRDGTPSRYLHSYSLTDDPLDTADVKLKQYGLYIGDEWAITNNFNLILGLRGEAPKFDEAPTRNPLTEQAFGARTDEIPSGDFQWSPRVGFNWDIKGDGTSQLRGGIGIFSGRPIYVWLSNNYANTGVEFARIEAFFDSDTPFFFTDPNNQPRDGLPTSDATDTEFNLIDPDFKYPQVLRTSIGYDQELPWDMIGTVEYTYTDNLEEVLYRNLNLQPAAERGANNRVIMEAVNPELGNAYYLTNTDSGYSYNTSLKLERPSTDGLAWSVSYTNGESRTLLDATSSRAVSNYVNLETAGNSNENVMGHSDFEIKHRYVANVTYTADWIKNNPTTIAVYYNLRSGRPYSTTYFGDANGDGNRFNDLIYVPASEDEIILTTDNWDELNAYIEGDPGLRGSRGQIVERNSSRDPWNSLIDLRIAQDIALPGSRLQLSIDIQNFGNLLDSDSGTFRRVRFNNNSAISYDGTDETTGRPMLRFFPNIDEENGGFIRTETIDTLSRWYGKLGVRWSF
jgi:hypothetical protein